MAKVFEFIFKYRRLVIVTYCVAVISLAISLYERSGRLTTDILNEQMLHRQQIVSRAGASHVSDVLEDWGRDLAFFATTSNTSIVDDKKRTAVLQQYITKYDSSIVSGVILTNSKGVVITNVNQIGLVDTGRDVSDRDYFKWAENAKSGDFFYGNPIKSRIGYTKDKEILTATTPIFKNGKFFGALTAVVDINKFADRYFEPLKVTDQTRIYLVDSAGKIVYSQYPQLQSANYFDSLNGINYPKKEESIKKFKDALMSNSEGKIIVDLPNQETKKIDTFLIAYSPVALGHGPTYKLAIATPVEQTYFFTGQVFNVQFRALSVFILIIVGFAILNLTILKLVKYHAYERGFKKGRGQI